MSHRHGLVQSRLAYRRVLLPICPSAALRARVKSLIWHRRIFELGPAQLGSAPEIRLASAIAGHFAPGYSSSYLIHLFER
jgi:hypothetical protein